LLDDFNFLNKNWKLAPKFSGPFKILCVKNPHNVELLLANGRKIVVNVARIKPYFSSATNSAFLSTPPSGIWQSHPMTDNTNGILMTEAFSDSANVFSPPTLTLTNTCKPGYPQNLATDIKVLSPTPAISFSKQGRDLHPGGVAVTQKNETEVTVAGTHPMRTRSQQEKVSAIAQDALMSRLNSVNERSFHCIVKKPRKKKQPRPSRPKLDLSFGDPYKYSSYPETGISEQPALNIDPFHDIIGNHYFDNSDNNANQDNFDSTDEDQYFDFDDILPFLEEDENEYDLDSAFCRYKAEASYQDEGEVHPLVQVPEDQDHDPALLRPATLPHQCRGQITMP